MSWEDQVVGFQKYGATVGLIGSKEGAVWGQVGMGETSKEELCQIHQNIMSGKMEMCVNKRPCVVTKVEKGESMTGKAKARFEGDTDRPLFHAVIGEKDCMFIAGCSGGNERCVVETLENKFAYLKKY